MRFRPVLVLLGALCVGVQSARAQEREATPAVVNPALSSPLRETISLDGRWDFATDPDREGDEEEWFLPGKELPGRGRGNNAENSDFWTIPHEPDRARPTIIHEYMNLGTDEDPRLASKYTGAMQPPCPIEPFRKELEEGGLSLQWGYACLDAGKELQSIYQKRGLEAARLDPTVDGYSYWTIVDCGRPSAQGLFNQFWEPKASTAESFRRFNGPTVLLAKMSPGDKILAEADELKIEWWISHFGGSIVEDKALRWKLAAGGGALQSGRIPGISAEVGDVKAIGTTTIEVPALKRALKAELSVELAGTEVKNSWELWLFPRIRPRPGAGDGMCASEAVHSVLADRYPGLTQLGSPEAANAAVILTDSLDADAVKGLDEGRNVILLKLKGIKPGVRLGWWWKCPQVGTAVAGHPAFGGFPHDGYLGEQFFRIVRSAVQMNKGGYDSADHLMLGYGYNRRAECSGGRGNLGYLLYAFQARAGKGGILASGLDLLSDKPESAYLLDEFITYVRSERFAPMGTLDVSKVK